jgi:uncharacterized membrane protein YdjX (TVP38/TMEM64 family)
MKPETRTRLFRVLALLFVIGISVALFLLRDRVRQLQGYGYPGIFLVQLLSSATVILPVPGIIITTAMGAVFNPFWVAIASASGAALGELSGYLAGFSGQGVAERTPIYEQIEGWMKRYGEWVILVLALIPNPFFDVAGMMAGALRMPVLRFLFWCWLGKVIKMLLFAYGGASLGGVLPFF